MVKITYKIKELVCQEGKKRNSRAPRSREERQEDRAGSRHRRPPPEQEAPSEMARTKIKQRGPPVSNIQTKTSIIAWRSISCKSWTAACTIAAREDPQTNTGKAKMS